MRTLRVLAEVALLTTLTGTILLLVAVQRSLRMVVALLVAACPILLVLTLHFSRDGCDLDSAFVTAVPPSSTRIVALWQCGALVCWSRSLRLQDGREVGVSATCEAAQGDKLQVPPPAPAGPPS